MNHCRNSAKRGKIRAAEGEQEMKIGLISDTHDNVPLVKKAVDVFNEQGVGLVFHAGDYVAPFSLKPLFGLRCDFKGVFGNNDGDRLLLQEVSKGRISRDYIVEEVDGKKILVGHRFDTLDALISSQQFSLIVHGHSHSAELRRVGSTLVINPGECGGWLYGMPSIAIVDMGRHEGTIISLAP